MSGIETLVAVGILVLIGLIILKVVGAILFFLPAAVITWIVLYLTGRELYAAVAFLAICILSLTRKK
ncbi:MAG: hypothetical protein NTY03_09580 [Candidatus Bathyarchaeota archaeon]|nr:hypothetical protein [Candidatus Bathyarchaeota archaeon]